jgi:transcription-repair coupling factor (superfamily II helicase)
MSETQTILSPPIPHKIKQPVFWSGLDGCADSLAIAMAIKNESRLFVVLTPDTQTALRIEHELAFFLQNEYPILHFPDWEILPYDVFSPLPEIVSERLKTLAKLPEVTRGVLVISIPTLMQRLTPRDYVLANSFSIKVKSKFNLDLQRLQLEAVGYQCVSQVVQHAEFAVRGSIIDLFPMGSQYPFRIDLMGEHIDSIRTFDPETQRSLDKVKEIKLYPAHEFPFTDDSIKHFRQSFRAAFPENYQDNIIYQNVTKQITPSGIEAYLPLFVDKMETLFDYLPATTAFILPETLNKTAEIFISEATERFEQRKYDLQRPLLAVDRLYLSREEFIAAINVFRRIYLTANQTESAWSANSLVLSEMTLDARLKEPASRLKKFIANCASRVLLVAETAGHREALLERLRTYKILAKKVSSWDDFCQRDESPCIVVAPLDHSLYLPKLGLVIITESQLTGDKAQQRRRRKKSSTYALEKMIHNLDDLTVGAPVVHQEHGVGRYLGLQVLKFGNIEAEFLTLEYANEDKLYVPVSTLNVIGRYTGASPENAPLHKLGGDQWGKSKKKALEKIHDVAVELLDIHAKRALKKGHAFKYSVTEYLAFADAFPFEETPDQQTAIDSILEDMHSPQPMDRVICGDVGFGKTEVAMRAAFIAAQGGKQVAVLVPTTLLAQQHYQNFRDRFADWPFRVEVLSRFITPKQQKIIIADLANGKVDIVLGTHKLLSKEIEYRDLGLVVIDEEHRFGVRQKEHFKTVRQNVDLLTLTATPIPRTLNMAMAGLREVSMITTPPPNRHVIRTFITEWIDSLVKEACQREIKRGGQMYFLHNDVKSMEKVARELEKLVPEAQVKIAHGQMAERELESIMLDFYHQRFNVLLSTTIIESGIDIPSANTIIINRADKLGLAQLHQLRGRVGRSHHRAYAYFIVPPKALISKDGVKRLEALEASGELGAGFMLSTHDMEIRGAGELLGDGQSGQIQEIGFTLYTELLERTVNALKSGKQTDLDAPLHSGTEVDLQTAALIPEDYMPDIHARLVLYKRISSAKDKEELRDLQVEMIDRFSLLPDPVKVLFAIAELTLLANKIGIKKIDVQAEGGRIVFDSEPKLNMPALLVLIQTQAAKYKFEGGSILRFTQAFTETEVKIEFITQLLTQLMDESE